MKINFFWILTVALSWGVFLSFTNDCYSINSGGLGIYPNQSEWNLKNDTTKSWFIYTLNLGEIKKAKVDIKNESDQSVVLKIYPVDAVTTKDGSFAPQSEDSIKNGVGSWINMSTTEFSLNPNEIKTIDFTIAVPQNADIGDHMGAIIIQNKKTSEAKIGTAVQVVNRLGARIYITIPGEKKEKLEIEAFDNTIENDKVVFQLTLSNKGNTRITPKGEIEIKDELGTVVDKINLTQREVFPRDTIVLPTKWEKTVKGNFTILATVKYGEQKLTKKLKLNTKSAEKKILGVQNTRKKINKFPIIGVMVVTISILILIIILRFL